MADPLASGASGNNQSNSRRGGKGGRGRGKGRRRGGGQHGRQRQRQQKSRGGCPLYREDFPQSAITSVPNAYLNDEWKCRSCNRLVASHVSRTDESYGKFLDMIPEHISPDNMLQLIPLAVRLASRNANGWQRMESHRDESDSTEVSNPTLSYYSLPRRHCQILGPATPHVVNAHIWPHHNRGNLDLMDLQESDIDNPKNILRLHKTIEQNFDQMNIMFEDTGGTTGIRQLRLKILNDDIRTTVLANVEPPKTMGEVDGSPLIFPNGNMPWNRLVGMHAHFALEKARRLNWLPEDQYTHAENQAMNLLAFSLDQGAASRINRWIEST